MDNAPLGAVESDGVCEMLLLFNGTSYLTD